MGNELKKIRTEKAMALRAVAVCASVPAATLSDIERYDYKPREETKARIAAALGVAVSNIWTEDTDTSQ